MRSPSQRIRLILERTQEHWAHDPCRPGRSPTAVRARWCAALLLRRFTGLSLKEIARILDVDHSSVVHALQSIEARAKRDGWWGDVLTLAYQVEKEVRDGISPRAAGDIPARGPA